MQHMNDTDLYNIVGTNIKLYREKAKLTQVQLAERFGMSRTPIREALVRLSGEGLIETLPNRSTMVSSIS